jgi:site-specific DNA-cytosine methylase
VPTFYEFFAGGGMARAGLGSGWKCLFANDFDPKKGVSYRANWGSKEFKIADVAKLTTADLPAVADGLGVLSLPGSFIGWRRRRFERGEIRHVLAVLETYDCASRRGASAEGHCA